MPPKRYDPTCNLIVGLALVFIVGAIPFIPCCADQTAENPLQPRVRQLVKENADLKNELTFRRTPEADQVELIKAERAAHQVEINNLRQQISQSDASRVDASLAPLQQTLNQIRAELNGLHQEVGAVHREAEVIKGSLCHVGADCHCGN